MSGGIVQPSNSEWSSPVFVAYQRSYGSDKPPKPRKVVDYRRLNAVTRSDTYPIPDIPELLEWLSQFRYFGAIDLKSGYWQKQIKRSDCKKTAFVTPRALLEYLRVAFGLKNAPAYFQREVNKMLADGKLRYSRGFIDDLLSGGVSWKQYLANQRELFLACLDHGWLVTVTKIRIGYTEIATLGHLVGHGFIKPDPEKVDAIKRLRAPTDERGVRALLGLVGYYRRFIPRFAKIAKPLTNLLSQN